MATNGRSQRILSMGAGVQTTACLLKYWDRYAYIVFADTGDEKPETYWYIDKYLKPFCEAVGVRWVTVRWDKYESLMDYSIKTKTVPFLQTRQCTKDFKIYPIRRFCRKIGGSKKYPVIQDIGISLDESHRANFSKYNPSYIKHEYPLIDDKITRRKCKEIIEEHGWPLPVKSGCDFCPFAKRAEFRKLSYERPERFKQIVAMEKNCDAYPKITIKEGQPLETLLQNQNLDAFFDGQEDKCDSGHCMT